MTAPPGFAYQDPPRRGEWRWHVAEAGQSVESFRASRPAGGPPGRRAFVIQPIGAAAEQHVEMLRALRGYAEAFFGLPARLAPPIPDFDEAWRPQRGQANASMIVARLADRAPSDARVYAGVVAEDLFAPGLDFVFGQGNLESGCGVHSLGRLGDPDAKVFLRRALKLFSHEGGHALGIAHCARWRCVMQGANTREEQDRHPMHLCPEDLEKLRWATGAEPLARYRALEAFYRAEGLEAEAAWAAGRIAESR